MQEQLGWEVEEKLGVELHLGGAAARVIDKLPDNYLHLGLIAALFPRARIIHCRRDPVDTCLSCFSLLFDGDGNPYTYDLGELGRFYRSYERLMAHWREILPQDAMLEVEYEDIVGDLEAQARRIVAYLGLEWDARCLDFHLTERPVRTASVRQVRQPIFKKEKNGRRKIVGTKKVHRCLVPKFATVSLTVTYSAS